METQITELKSIAEVIRTIMPAHAAQAGRTAIRIDDGQKYLSLSYREYLDNIRIMANFLAAQTGKAQQVVATFCLNRPEWDMTALAAFYTGNILFPIDTKMNEAELEHLLSLSRPDFILVSAAQKPRLTEVLERCGCAACLITADLYRVYEDSRSPSAAAAAGRADLRMSDIAAQYRERDWPPPSALLDERNTVLAHFATSGTIGLPRVVAITHGNILCQLREGLDILKLRPNEDFLNIGAYTHIATLVEFLVAKTGGYSVVYFTREADEDGVLEGEIKKLKKQGVRIKALMAVPKFWVYILKEALEELKGKKPFASTYAYLVSIEKSGKSREIGTLEKAKLAAARTFLRDKLGGYFTYGISSSTKIDPGIVEIFAQLGITIIDIYGATEASGIIARNRLNESRSGSCGRLISSLESRLKDARLVPGFAHQAGELEIRGPTVMQGYVGDPVETRDKLSGDGFFSTGDLAYVDEDGWVFLIGRNKELIPADDGSYVDPMRLSNLLVRSIYVKDAMVARLGRDEFLSVFILPDYPRLAKDREYCERVKAGMEERQALRCLLEEAVEYARSLANSSIPLSTQRIYLLDKKLERTPTHKIKFLFELSRLNLQSYV